MLGCLCDLRERKRRLRWLKKLVLESRLAFGSELARQWPLNSARPLWGLPHSHTTSSSLPTSDPTFTFIPRHS